MASRSAPPGRLNTLAAAVLVAWAGHASALPTGAQPVAGNVSVARPDARTLNVTQRSDKAIINWTAFNVGAGEAVNFAQPAVTSVILNRVVGGSFSEILGRISANGQVFLVNPLGVTLGTGAQVDAAGFVASTLSISDSDFLSGRYVFSNAGNAGAVVNRGIISTGSLAALLAPQVANEGTITARLGTVGLAAGDRVSLDVRGDGLVKFSVDKAAVDASISNHGAIIAEGGQILMSAQSANAMLDTVINMKGVARATALSERNGTIVLDGGPTGVVAVTGTLDASGRNPGERGGTVKVLGDKVGIFDGARIDASGDRGGGTVLVGGNWQGKGTERNSTATFASAEATIAADAIDEGNGGKVVVWSDGVTRAGVDIKARGGARGGDGGAVEVSGKEHLEFAGRVDTSAPTGKRGMLLLDPRDLIVNDAPPPDNNITGDGSSGDAFRPNGNASVLTWATLESFTSSDVFVTTLTTGGDEGHITIAASPTAYNNSGNLTFTAVGDINIIAAVANAGSGGFTFTAGSGKKINLGGDLNSAGGAVSFASPVTVTGDAAVTTAGGDVTFSGAVTLNANASISAGTGAVAFASTVAADAPDTRMLSIATTGTTTFGGAVGAGPRLAALTTTGAGVTQVNGGLINAATQSYGDTVTLGAASTTLSGTTGTLSGGVNGAGNDLTLNFSTATTVGGGSFANVKDFSSTGPTNLSGTITTAGSQSYGGAVTLAGNTTLVSTGNQAVSLNSTVDAAVADTQSLSVNTGGVTTFGGAVGTTRLAALTTDAVGTTAINTTAITTGGSQTYGDSVTLGANATLTSQSGATIAFAGSVTGAAPNAQSLTVNTTGTTTFGGAVGATRLAALTTDAGGSTQVSGGSVNAATQTYNDALALGANTTLSGVTGSFPSGITGNGFDLTLNFSGLTTVSGGTFVGVDNFSVGNGGTASLSGTITTAGSQTYGDAVTLTGNTILVSTGGQSIALNNTVDGAAPGVQSLTVNTAGATSFGNTVGAMPLSDLNTDAPGTTTISAAAITTSGAQNYGDPVVVGANTILTSLAAGAIGFAGTVTGAAPDAQSLTVNTTGTATFSGAVGATRLAALTTNAGGITQVNGGSINAVTQTYNDTLTLGAHTTLSGITGSFPGGIAGNDFDLALNFSGATTVSGAAFGGVRNFSAGAGGTTNLSGTIVTAGSQTYDDAVTLGGVLTTLVSSNGQSITFNNTVVGTAPDAQSLTVNTAGQTTFGGAVGGTRLAALTTDAPGTTQVNGGSINALIHTYDDSVNLGANTTFTGTTGTFGAGIVGNARNLTLDFSGLTTVDGTTFSGVNDFAVGNGGTTNLSGIITTAGSQSYGDAVTLTGNTTLVSSGNQSIALSNTVDAVGVDAQSLTVNTGGTTMFGGLVGTTRLAALSTDAGGSTAINTAAIITGGAQNYGDAVTLMAANTTMTSMGGAGITFAGNVTGTAPDAQSLTVNTSGATTFNGAVGATRLAALTTGAGGPTQVNGGSINAATQLYFDALDLGADTALSGVTGSFPGGISGNNFDLALNFSGLTTVSGGTFVGVDSFSVGSGGTTNLSGTITTAGSQIYGDAVTLIGDTTLVSTGGQSIALNNTVDGAAPDTQSLALNTTGTTAFGAAVGATRLAALTTDALGTTQMNGGSINAIAQSYNDSVSLGAHTALTGTTGSFGAGIVGNGFNLTLNFSAASSVTGGINGVNDFTVGNGGTTSLSGAISTTGSQTYGDALTLTADTILVSTGNQTIALNNSVDGAAPDAQSLTVSTAGTTAFAGPVGTTRLATLATDTGGTTIIDTAAITTGGAQTYGDAVTLLAAGATLTSAGGAGITFAGSVTGAAPEAQSLTVNTTGVTTFGGAVGATRLGALITDAGGTSQVNGGSVNAATQVYNDTLALGANAVLSGTTGSFVGAIAGNGLDLTLNFTGVTTVNGSTFANVNNFASGGGGTTNLSGIVSTLGSQTYADAVTLTVDTTLVSTGNQAISLNGTVDAAVVDAQSLTVNTGGATTFGGAVGTTRLAALTTDAGGTTAINTTAITSGGAQTYGDAVTLGANATLTSALGAAIAFASTVNAAVADTQSLTVNTTGTTTFGGAVGATRLAALTTDAGGSTQVNGGSINAGTQTYNDALTLGANTTLSGTTGTFTGAIAGGGFDLALNFSGPTSVSGTTFSGVNNFSTGNGGTTTLSGTITTAGSQTYDDAVTLAGDTTLASTGNQAITLSGAVNGTVDDAQALTVNSGGVTTFAGTVGATRLASLVTDAGGTTAINAGAITTGGAQSYGDAVTLGANAVLASAGGGPISFGGAVDGARTLAVNSSGATTFGGPVGVGTALTALTTDAGGTTQVNGGVVAAGTQAYNDALTLGADTTFTGATGAFTGAIAGGGFDLALDFSGATAVDGSTFSAVNNFSAGGGGTTSLSGTITTAGSQTYADSVSLTGATTLASSGNQAITLNGAVNGAQSLAINTAGATTFGAAAGATTALASLATDAGGTTAINGGSIRTSGAQTYNDGVIVNANASVTSTGAGAVAFNSTLDGAGSLNVNTAGATSFNGVVGGATALASIATDAPGTVALNGGAITTTGAQGYNEPVLLGASTTLTSTGAGNIGFAGTVNGAQALAVNTAGTTIFGAAVGGVAPLASMTTDAGGSTAIDGASVASSGAQRYGDAVALAGATTFSTAGGALAFDGTLSAPGLVTVSGAGAVTVAQGLGSLALMLTTPTTASANASGNLSIQGTADQTIVLGNSSAGGTLNVDAAGSGSITQLAGTTLSSAGNLRLRAPNGEITVGDVSTGTRIELNNTGPAPGLTGEGKAILQHADSELSAPFVRLLGGFNGLGADGNALGARNAPIRFGGNVQQVDYAAPVGSLVFFAGPIQLQESKRIFLITPPGGTETFDYNGGSGRVASNVAGEVVGGITSQITSQVDASFRPGRIDQAILFGFQGDLSIATLPVFGAIKGVLLPPLSTEDAGEAERKRRQ
jgi:filamentous hemagglutinin family protein